MLIEALQRIETAAADALAAANRGPMSEAEARQVLEVCKPAMAALSAVRTAAARVVAFSQRHGDGGAQILADAAGLTRHEAHSQVRTAETLQAAPAVRDAVESGRVSHANAKRLAETIDRTDATAVESDGVLLAKAESMRPEQFVREARRWTADRQHDGGEGDYRRLRAKRSVRIFDGDDGMVHLRGSFDPVAGRRIANRLNLAARRLHAAGRGGARPAGERPSLPQCLADALDDLTAGGSAGGAKPHADICVVAHVDADTGNLIGELPDGSRLPASVLDELTCNATITGVIFDRCGKPIWRTTAGRDATVTQRRLLNARWGGCFHCGDNFAICQPHHIDPVSQGGRTCIENLVPACWECHNRIHRDGWQIHKSPDGNHTLHPPQRVSFGPARLPDHPGPAIASPSLFATRSESRAGADPPARDGHNAAADCSRPAIAVPRRPNAPPDPGLDAPPSLFTDTLDPSVPPVPADAAPAAAPDTADAASRQQRPLAGRSGPAAARAALRAARQVQAARGSPV